MNYSSPKAVLSHSKESSSFNRHVLKTSQKEMYKSTKTQIVKTDNMHNKTNKQSQEEVIIINQETRHFSKSKNIHKTMIVNSLQGKRGAEYDIADVEPHISDINKKQRVGYDKGKIVSNNSQVKNSPLGSEEGINEGLTSVVAVDCEMVMVRGNIHELARCSIVNYHGHVLFDKMIKPKGKITNYLTWVSGITPGHLKDAEEYDAYRAEILEILKGKIIVGHSIHNDFDALNFYPQDKNVRDLAQCKYLKKDGKLLSLKKMSSEYLQTDIQKGQHDSVEDARASMALYRKFEKQWEEDIKHANYGMVKTQFLYDLNQVLN